jgi:hypothetical protein
MDVAIVTTDCSSRKEAICSGMAGELVDVLILKLIWAKVA